MRNSSIIRDFEISSELRLLPASNMNSVTSQNLPFPPPSLDENAVAVEKDPMVEELEQENTLLESRLQVVRQEFDDVASRLERTEQALEDELSELKKQARGAGFADGQKTAMEQLNGERERLDTLLKSIETNVENDILALNNHVTAAVMAALAQLIDDDSRLAEFVPNVVASCLRQISDKIEVILRLAPVDLEVLKHVDFTDRRIKVVPDQAITPGGCIVESAEFEIDARVETIMARLYEALKARTV